MRETDGGAYADILRVPRPASERHPPMPRKERAAQFAPFAALTGLDESLAEEGRQTEERILIDDGIREELERALAAILPRVRERPQVTGVRFLPDRRKAGGAYVPFAGALRGVDEIGRALVFTDGSRIPLEDIIALSPAKE